VFDDISPAPTDFEPGDALFDLHYRAVRATSPYVLSPIGGL
jgi:hypothetical protein